MKKVDINVKRKFDVTSEENTIKSILSLARAQGVEEKVKKLISTFQVAVKGAKSENERKQIAALGLAESHKTIGCVGELVVDGVEILPADTSYQDTINMHKKITKLD